MKFVKTLIRTAALSLGIAAAGISLAQEPFKIGLVLPMTGPFGLSGHQVEAGVRLYMAQHGDTVAGRKVEIIVKDDTGLADVARRHTQELVINDKVDVLAGYGLTPLGLAAAPVATQSKKPMVVMVAATASVIQASPYMVRSSFTMPQVASGIADWAPKNGIRNVVTLVTDYGPGIDTERAFKERFTAQGGRVIDSLRVPMRNADFAPTLQHVRDLKPDALFVFVAESSGLAVMKQFVERDLDKAGIRLIGTGDMVGDDILNSMGDVALGIVTSHHYSAAHPGRLNSEFVKGYAAATGGARANFMAVAGYDGMHLVYEALKKTQGQGDGDALLAAMKGQHFESPRGPVAIDPETRDIVQDVYLRKVERRNGQLYNVEFDAVEHVKGSGSAN
jgi:branched-chain amino acid transport system substrate-binding protein